MKQLDLFAGIGGISLAAEWAGIETVAFCEKEPFAQSILRRRFPGRPVYDDVFHLTREVLERDGITGIDIVAGGFPCQPFSHAGRRTGTADDRYLWPEMCRIVGELRPAWVFAENVDGLVSMAQSGGQLVLEDETTLCEETEMVLETIRKDLEDLGYQSVPVIVPACGVGAAHRRYRIFILGYTEHSGCGGQSWRRTGQEHADEQCGMECGAVADSTVEGLQEWRRSGVNPRAAEAGAGMESESERCCSLANTDCKREPQSSWSIAEIGKWVSDSCQDVADSDEQHVDNGGYGTSAIRREQQQTPKLWRSSPGTTQSGMGRGTYELSDWLDEWGMNPIDALINFVAAYPQPALMGHEQHSWEPSRVADGVKNRSARLKALGNAVDPLQALPVLYGIRVMHEFLSKGGRLL